MKALRKLQNGPGAVALADVPPPAVLPGTVIVQVTATGVCGTDLHIEAGEYQTNPPVTMGHEIAGVVTQVGAGVSPSWTGQAVACETFFDTCEKCRWCRAGRLNLCPDRRSLGTHVDGGFAAGVVVPARNLHQIPAGIDTRAASLTEPLACVCHALLDPPRICAGDRVLVTGPGSIGILAAQVARAAGAWVQVAGLPADRDRLDVAASLGAVTTTHPATDIDVVIECSGSEGGARTCLSAAARGGRYIQLGIFGDRIELDLDVLLVKELVVTSGFASTPAAWRRALAILAAGEIRLEPLISTVRPLEQWQSAFQAVRSGNELKVLLTPPSDG